MPLDQRMPVRLAEDGDPFERALVASAHDDVMHAHQRASFIAGCLAVCLGGFGLSPAGSRRAKRRR